MTRRPRSTYDALPISILKLRFDETLKGIGEIRTDETCSKKWKMMIDSGIFFPVGDDECRIDGIIW